PDRYRRRELARHGPRRPRAQKQCAGICTRLEVTDYGRIRGRELLRHERGEDIFEADAERLGRPEGDVELRVERDRDREVGRTLFTTHHLYLVHPAMNIVSPQNV